MPRRSSTSPSPVPTDLDLLLRGLLFWSFVGVALLLFAASILLPEWRETRLYAAQRDAMAQRTDALESRVNRQKREVESVRTSPQVLQRLLERDLRYRNLNEEQVVLVSPMHQAFGEARREPEFTPATTPQLPAWLGAKLPGGAWLNVFYDLPDRNICLVLSGVLLVSAFWLFQPGRPVRVNARR